MPLGRDGVFSHQMPAGKLHRPTGLGAPPACAGRRPRLAIELPIVLGCVAQIRCMDLEDVVIVTAILIPKLPVAGELQRDMDMALATQSGQSVAVKVRGRPSEIALEGRRFAIEVDEDPVVPDMTAHREQADGAGIVAGNRSRAGWGR